MRMDSGATDEDSSWYTVMKEYVLFATESEEVATILVYNTMGKKCDEKTKDPILYLLTIDPIGDASSFSRFRAHCQIKDPFTVNS